MMYRYASVLVVPNPPHFVGNWCIKSTLMRYGVSLCLFSVKKINLQNLYC